MISDTMVFLLLLVALAVGYFSGYHNAFRRGWYTAQAEGLIDYPLINVHMELVRDDIYRFYYILDDAFIMQGTIEECSEYLLGEVDEDDIRKIIFAKLPPK